MESTGAKENQKKIQEIISYLVPFLSEDSRVLAMFLGGSLANGRFDQYSDVDLKLVVERNSVSAVVDFIVKKLRERYKILDMMGINGEQAMELILRFDGLSPYNLFDITLFRDPFMEQSIDQHGRYKVIFDKAEIIAQTSPSDEEIKKITLLRLQGLERMAHLFSLQTDKEIRRGRVSDAFMYYRRNYNRMADAARALYAPRRLCMQQGRYIEDDIPEELSVEFRKYLFPSSTDELLYFDRQVTEKTLELISKARAAIETKIHA